MTKEKNPFPYNDFLIPVISLTNDFTCLQNITQTLLLLFFFHNAFFPKGHVFKQIIEGNSYFLNQEQGYTWTLRF